MGDNIGLFFFILIHPLFLLGQCCNDHHHHGRPKSAVGQHPHRAPEVECADRRIDNLAESPHMSVLGTIRYDIKIK
ncbi:MAG: hypothetical protein BYD32DRAFT_408304, partial [Podila humilis]